MSEKVSGESLFGLPVAHETGLSRLLIEHGDGRWSLALVRDAVVKEFPDRPVWSECTFTMDDALETARLAFSSDPTIRDDKFAGKKLAAALLMFAHAMGLTELEKKG
ncbi:hypothetical protein [Rhizobium sp. Leaf386]|uniref:hypothetical protein n=1 Tax=Rhizobium sp. Leaf386 TaxID=1736359 RepID=UPI000712D217|nr:hypothetical protein [Rhizobium sp. Leaf386]KQS95359.1 hypothetical protein ASG50_25375 [Rhizobium sp. Leaf386]